ncbi:ABC transporter permease [Fodinicola acaciae]|uniref:ABC transporter permease n=1 Tax=Fodinicola acaciae TaxID=2681555 RepID=UPI0013CFF697|nr:ABC transporter permease [Fodinicola acaciae]
MIRYTARRLAITAIQLFCVGTIVFVLLRLVPGDPAKAVLGENATESQLDQIRHQLGLDQPLVNQFLGFWEKLLHGDLGSSLISGRAVVSDLNLRFGNTLELVVCAVVLALIVGIPLGMLAAVRANKATDHVVTGGAVLGLSFPVFVLGGLLVLIFSQWLPILPPTRFEALQDDPLVHLRLLILPVLTLTAAPAAVVTRMARSAMLEVLSTDYVRTARAKGIGERKVIVKHALRNSMNAVASVTGLELATLLGGTVIVETIFGWPGLSSLLMSGIRSSDYPVVQGVVLVIAVLTILINMLVDFTLRVLDPRIGAA